MKSLWFRNYLITLYQCTQAIPGSDLRLIELIQKELYDKFVASISVWIFLWRLINFIQAVGSPLSIFHFIVLDEIGKNPLEYMKVQILDSFSATMRQQPENVDHLRCCPIKTLR